MQGGFFVLIIKQENAFLYAKSVKIYAKKYVCKNMCYIAFEAKHKNGGNIYEFFFWTKRFGRPQKEDDNGSVAYSLGSVLYDR